MKPTAAILLIALAPLFWSLTADAHPAFKKQFDDRYMKKGTALHTAYGGRSNCNVCHIGGFKDRKNRNAYGDALSKLLTKKDADNLSFKVRKSNPQLFQQTAKKVQSVLEKVEAAPSNPKHAKSATFGELIRTGKLPVSPKTLPK